MSLKNFLEGQKLPGNTLIVSIIKKLQPFKFIAGDSSGLALLKIAENQEKDIQVGMTVKLIKPDAIDNQTIQSNKSFKPMKSKDKIKLTPTEEDLSKFEVKEEKNQIKNDLTTFQFIKENQSQIHFSHLTILVTNVSRIIETNSGKYQIVAIMDINSEKTSINLYDPNIGKLQFGEIYNITKVKKKMLRKDQATELRLLTTKFTKISEANEEDKGKFENVKLADKQIQGIIVGFGEINSYKSCEKHWNKLDEDDLCPKCESPPTKVKIDFNTDLYIQDSSTGDIKSFIIFKRQITTISNGDDHNIIEGKLTELEGTSCQVEFDETENDDQVIIPKRLQLANQL